MQVRHHLGKERNVALGSAHIESCRRRRPARRILLNSSPCRSVLFLPEEVWHCIRKKLRQVAATAETLSARCASALTLHIHVFGHGSHGRHQTLGRPGPLARCKSGRRQRRLRVERPAHPSRAHVHAHDIHLSSPKKRARLTRARQRSNPASCDSDSRQRPRAARAKGVTRATRRGCQRFGGFGGHSNQKNTSTRKERSLKRNAILGARHENGIALEALPTNLGRQSYNFSCPPSRVLLFRVPGPSVGK